MADFCCNPKSFVVGKDQLSDFSLGERKCYLLCNGLGGFSSLTAVGSCGRHDHGLLISAKKAPNYRVHLVTNVEESICSGGLGDVGYIGDKNKIADLYSQQFATRTSSIFNGKYINSFEFSYLPQWSFKVGDFEIVKDIVMVYGENTVAVRYRVYDFGDLLAKDMFAKDLLAKDLLAKDMSLGDMSVQQGVLSPEQEVSLKQGSSRHGKTLSVKPLFRLTNKDDFPSSSDNIKVSENFVENLTWGNKCYFKSNGNVTLCNTEFYNDMFFEYDSRDGRDCIGKSFKCCQFDFEIGNDKEKSGSNNNMGASYGGCQEFFIVFSDKEINIETVADVNQLFDNEIERQKKLIKTAGIKDSAPQSLVLAADKFITFRESTKCKTIMAGYPFFGDWGRDTMISLIGCVLAGNRFEDCKSILRTFKAYEKKGMMPNVFPEGEADNPMYNTVDASLLFINSVYEYFKATGDIDFVKEMYSTMESIVYNYRNGTDFHIKMDDDGLITAGAGLEQLTWMDVRFGDILPTPRQGKAVEINAYWYNALRIMDFFAEKTGEDKKDYYELSENFVKPNFLKLFWNEEKGCLRDVISVNSGCEADNQIRPNQVWALSMAFSMIDKEKAVKILSVIYNHLYTPWGLRSLSPYDRNFHETYGGSHFNRDMAYHQGTVWGFPLGAYYIGVLRFCDNGAEIVKRQLKYTETSLNEGCLGQIAEIYDGENPWESQGCFAQAWSVGEILRVYKELGR